MNLERFYVTTAIPYVNAEPHIGFALELVQADVFARFHRLKGEEVFFLTGTDENSLKNVQAAEAAGISTKELVDKNAEKFQELVRLLNISNDDFIRTTEERHIKGAQKLWNACRKEDLYRKKYKGLYCVGCETFYTERELEDGLCPEHKTKPDLIEEENYFFKLSNYQAKLEETISKDTLRIVPEARKNEVLSFIRQGLEDFSISRSRKRAKNWGIPVPGDNSQIMYVWFDALSNYLNGVGYADDEEKFDKWWSSNKNILHLIGKGIIRFHAVYWPAMLLSAGLNLPKTIFVHGYITADNQKISKSLGNVVDPFYVVNKYGQDAIRYFLLREIPATGDGDFSYKKLEERYNGDLVNGIGNYASRVLAMVEKFCGGRVPNPAERIKEDVSYEGGWEEISKKIENEIIRGNFDKSLAHIWEYLLSQAGDEIIDKKKPWELAKIDPGELDNVLYHRLEVLRLATLLLKAFIPDKAGDILEQLSIELSGPWEKQIKWGGLEPGLKIKKGAQLFPRRGAE